jgi:nicotinamidase-related amidase
MRRALIVIDVQNEYFTGAMPITHPVGHLENILKVMDAASGVKVPTVVVRHAQPDPNSPVFRKGGPEWQLHPAVAAEATRSSS